MRPIISSLGGVRWKGVFLLLSRGTEQINTIMQVHRWNLGNLLSCTTLQCSSWSSSASFLMISPVSSVWWYTVHYFMWYFKRQIEDLVLASNFSYSQSLLHLCLPSFLLISLLLYWVSPWEFSWETRPFPPGDFKYFPTQQHKTSSPQT